MGTRVISRGSLLFALVALTATALAQWSVVNLHPAGSTDSKAFGVSGPQQAGTVNFGQTSHHASLWSGTAASWIDLTPDHASGALIYGMSDGQQTGVAFVPGRRASLWYGSKSTWVDLNPAESIGSEARGGDNEQQVGFATIDGTNHASLWSGSAASWVDLNPSGVTQSEAADAHAGQQVGWAKVGNLQHASLWSGSAASWVDLNPTGVGVSVADGVFDGMQMGLVFIDGRGHASLWTGTAESWVDLHPAGTTNSRVYSGYNGLQVGEAWVNGYRHASLWSGTAESWLDLHTFLPAHFTWSEAQAVWQDGNVTYVVGEGNNSVTGRREALMWVNHSPITHSDQVLLVHGLWSSSKAWSEKLLFTDSLFDRLSSAGYEVSTIDFTEAIGTNEGSIPAQAIGLSSRIREVLAASGDSKINLVCHSMGGLAARWYLTHSELWPSPSNSGVLKLVTIATPHWGTDIFLQNPIIAVIAARMGDGTSFISNNYDTHLNWSSGLKDMFAEWQPAPQLIGGVYGYPTNSVLTKWPTSGSQYQSPITDYTFDLASLALKLLRKDDDKAVRAAVKAFPKKASKRFEPHAKYYNSMIVSLGTPYQPDPLLPARRISDVLREMNLEASDDSGAHVYMIAGLENRVVIKYLGDMRPGPFRMPSDAFVPRLSALGIDPITGSRLYPDASTFVIEAVFANHTDISKMSIVADKIIEWLN